MIVSDTGIEVLKAISKVQAAMSVVGVAKSTKVKDKNGNLLFECRGIDAVMNALSHELSEAQLIILPQAKKLEKFDEKDKYGNHITRIIVTFEFKFISAIDGSREIAVTYGEGMDKGDKATTKSMAIAYKYALCNSFCIPTEATHPEADKDVYELQDKPELKSINKKTDEKIKGYIQKGMKIDQIISNLGNAVFVSENMKNEIRTRYVG